MCEIQENLVYLSENLTNLNGILRYLEQNKIFSRDECEEIKKEITTTDKNYKLLSLMQKKDWDSVRNLFLEILRKTNNHHCASVIEGISWQPKNSISHPKIPKWWPDKKELIKSLHKRKFGSRLLVEELQDRILRDENRMVVICESADASKYSGMGGVGKTLTAKWYAHNYQEYYEHILSIDCGEGSLVKSFKKLARDLKVEDFDKLLDVEDYCRKSYEELEEWKCLWIFDNAESYQGKEGIKKVLPKNKENFSCLITSRSREWGFENGYGKMTHFELDIFGENESLELLKANLKKEIKYTECNLKELSRLVGNLPLALQLTIAALNSGKIDVQSYIEKNKFEKIVDKEFDDYEKTISGNVKISLDLILKEECGNLAHEILMIFGYIGPDVIEVEFFKEALNLEDERKIKGAIKLLKKYSLVGKTKKEIKKEMKIVLSIHRLLQQVIRHNGRKTETLRKILGCHGFIGYKFIPFTKYADERLQKEYPKVRAELLDQQQLHKLIREERFQESVQLAKSIHEELKTTTTKFNYAICLDKNGQLEKCVNTLDELFTKRQTMENDLSRCLEKMLEYMQTKDLKINIENNYCYLMELKRKPTEMEIGNILFYSYLSLRKIEDAITVGKQIANKKQIFTILSKVLEEEMFEDSVQLAKFIYKGLKTSTTMLNYAICLDKNGELEKCLRTLEELDKQEMKEEGKYERDDVRMGIMKLEKKITRDLVVGQLLVVYWRMDNKKRVQEILEERKQFKIILTDESLDSLIGIVNSDLMTYNYSLTKKYSEYILNNITYTSLIELDLNVTTKKIELRGCSLSLSSFDRLSPEELYLDHVSFSRDGVELKQVTVNEFLDFNNIKRLSLGCDKKSNMRIELSGDVFMESLLLDNVKVLDRKDAYWNLQKLELRRIPFLRKSKLKVNEMKIEKSSVDISCLPITVQQLYLGEVEVSVSGGIDLPLLKYLTLYMMKSSSVLFHFSSLQLTHVHFNWIQELNLSHLPISVTRLKISNQHQRIVVGRRKLDKVILDRFSLQQVEECLSHFQTENLVIHKYLGISSKELLELMKTEIKTIAVGRINWEQEENFEILSSHVDRKADYYLLEGGMGRGIDKEEFEELEKLY